MSRKPRFYLRSPSSVADVQNHLEKGLLSSYRVEQRNAARRLINEAIARLPERFPNPWQIKEYEYQFQKLTRLMSYL